MDPANSSGKHTKTKTKLFHKLDKMVQDHIRTKLKLHHHGHKLRKLVSRCPSNTKHHILERHKYFKMIQQHIHRNIGHMVNTNNDHSAPYNDSCLKPTRYGTRVVQRAEARVVQRAMEGDVRFFSPPSPRTIPAHNLHKTKTQPSNKQAHNNKKTCHLTK